jgi:glycosyltransferase involved in cell wall biosynthesis
MAPLVTIGIPCYNSERWLKNAIESALAQTWSPCEVIVVDDGSTDSSLIIASAFGDRITLFRRPHRGATVARNLILQEAAGEWIQYLDADDLLTPGKIATQLQEGGFGSEADLLYSAVIIEEVLGGAHRRYQSNLDLGRDLFAQWFAWELPQTGGCLWRRSALEELGGWRKDQPCCQEHELYARALRGGLRFRHTPSPGAIYRVWSDATLCRKDPRRVVVEKTKLIDTMREWMEARRLWTPTHAAVAGRACFEMARILAARDLAEGARYFRDRRRRGLIHLAGPAAPAAYTLAHRLLGFRGAEMLARLTRG